MSLATRSTWSLDDDGSSFQAGASEGVPGDVMAISPGHDSWVFGDDPTVDVDVSKDA